jgi:hypothetical protein
LYRIVPDYRDYRYGRRCRLGGKRRRDTCGDYRGYRTADKFSGQQRKPFDSIVCPPVHNCYVLALDVTGIFQALAKSSQSVFRRVRGPGIEISDNRYCWLLRMSRERPSGRRTTKKFDELTPPHDCPARLTIDHSTG